MSRLSFDPNKRFMEEDAFLRFVYNDLSRRFRSEEKALNSYLTVMSWKIQ